MNMKKKKIIKKKRLTPEYDSKREYSVILEKVYSEIKTLGEGHGFLSEEFEEMKRQIQKIETNSFKTEMNIQAIKSQVGTIDIKSDRIERELDTVKKATIESYREIKELKATIGTVTADHDHRIQKLEVVR